VGPRSRRSLFRDLTALGYLSSYTHTGRYSSVDTSKPASRGQAKTGQSEVSGPQA
jgi:hypothetical protein